MDYGASAAANFSNLAFDTVPAEGEDHYGQLKCEAPVPAFRGIKRWACDRPSNAAGAKLWKSEVSP